MMARLLSGRAGSTSCRAVPSWPVGHLYSESSRGDDLALAQKSLRTYSWRREPHLDHLLGDPQLIWVGVSNYGHLRFTENYAQ